MDSSLPDENGPNPYDPQELMKDPSLMAELEELERRMNGVNITKSPEVKSTVVSAANHSVSPEIKPRPTTKVVSPPSVPVTKKNVSPMQKQTVTKVVTLDDLENEIRIACAYAFKESKDARQAGDDKKAQIYFKDYKYYDDQMKELLKMKDDNGSYSTLFSPVFHWTEEKSEIKIENVDIGEHQIYVSVDVARELQHVISNNYEGYTVNCEYNLGIPKENRIIGTFQGKCLKDGIIQFNYKKIHKCEKISKGYKTYYTNGYATFKLTLQSFWGFKSTELGTAIFPLEELMSCSDKVIECRLVDDKNEKLSKAKQLPGTLVVHIRLRHPLVNPHVEFLRYRKLIIGDVKNLAANNIVKIAPSDKTVAATINKPNKYEGLHKKELEDPLSVTYMTSIYVYQSKIEELKQMPNGDEEMNMEKNMTILACENLINHLIEQVNSGKLSPEVYGAQLKDRISRDKLLIEYFTENPNEEFKQKILKRIELIEHELQETELA